MQNKTRNSERRISKVKWEDFLLIPHFCYDIRIVNLRSITKFIANHIPIFLFWLFFRIFEKEKEVNIQNVNGYRRKYN